MSGRNEEEDKGSTDPRNLGAIPKKKPVTSVSNESSSESEMSGAPRASTRFSASKVPVASADAHWEQGPNGEASGTAKAKGPGGASVEVSQSGGKAAAGYDNVSRGSRGITSGGLGRQSHPRRGVFKAEPEPLSNAEAASVVSELEGGTLPPGSRVTREDLLQGLRYMCEFMFPQADYRLSKGQRMVVRYCNNQADWEAHRGAFLRAAELGHLILDTEGPPEDICWLTVGTLTGLVLNMNVHEWLEARPGLPLLQCLPEDFAELFDPAGDVLWHGVDIMGDIDKKMGITNLGDRWVDSQIMLDSMICRGSLCHFWDGRPRSSMLEIQLSLLGPDYHTAVFYGQKGWDAKMGKTPMPKHWNGKIPAERSGRVMFDWNKTLSEPQANYNCHDIYTIASLILTKVQTVVLANPEFEGAPLDRELLDAVIAEDRAKTLLAYNQAGVVDLKRNCFRRKPGFPKLTGQKTLTLRHGRYVGPDLRDMNKEPDKPKFGSSAYWKLEETKSHWKPEETTSQGSGAASGVSQTLRDPAATTTTAKQDAQKRKVTQRYADLEIQGDDDSDGNGEDLLDVWDVNSGDPAPSYTHVDCAQPADIPGRDVPVQEPFWRYLLPSIFDGKTDQEKWDFVKKVRHNYRPISAASAINRGQSGAKPNNAMARVDNPTIKERCMFCGNRFHTYIDRFYCKPEAAKCIYSKCTPHLVGQTAQHNVKVCRTLQWGCRKCRMRGHHPDSCDEELGKHDSVMEENRAAFEAVADLGYNTSKRYAFPYLGCVFFYFHCFTKMACPMDYETEIKTPPMGKVIAAMIKIVDDCAKANANRKN